MLEKPLFFIRCLNQWGKNKDLFNLLDPSSQIRSTLNYIKQAWITFLSRFLFTEWMPAWGTATARQIKWQMTENDEETQHCIKRYWSVMINQSRYAMLNACPESDPLMDFPPAWLLFRLIRLSQCYHSVIMAMLHTPSIQHCATTIRPGSILPIKCNCACIYREDLEVTGRHRESLQELWETNGLV